MPKKKAVKKLPANDDANYLRNVNLATDTYSNPPARVGDFTPNLVNTGQYPLVRLTEQYPLILSLYRGSWIVRRIIDKVANDMYRTFPVLDCALEPDEITAFNKVIKLTHTIPRLRSAAKWGRLFGGAGAIIVIDGHDDLMEPLDIDKIELGSYKGLIPLDRWSGIIPGPEIDSNINNPANFGLPTYYNCIMDAGNVNIHHSRILRFTGRELPQWEVQVELYWGMSEVEIIFDELKKRDYSSWNIVSLLTRAQILSLTEPQLATLRSGAGGSNTAYNDFVQRMELFSQTLNNQGLAILSKDGKLETHQYSFGGIADVYHEFMKDLSAACDMPYEIVFGRESGLGGGGNFTSNGASSIQIYDNMIEEKRTSEGNPVVDKLLPVVCMSTLGYLPDDLAYHWSPIRAVTDQERNELGKTLTESVLMAYNADLITKREARSELAKQSGTNGLFSIITPEAIAETPDTYASETGIGDMPLEGEEGEEGTKQAGGEATMPGNKAGVREGEQVPIESKPIGVAGLRWHKSKRITKPEDTHKPGMTTGKGQSTSAHAAEQQIKHSIKHEMKGRKK